MPLPDLNQTKLRLNFPVVRDKKNQKTGRCDFAVFTFYDLETKMLVDQFTEAVQNYHKGLNNGVEIIEK